MSISKETFRKALDAGITKVLDDPPENPIHEDETFVNYGIDSLDMMNLLLFLEDEIGIDSDIIESDDKLTPASFYDIINKNI